MCSHILNCLIKALNLIMFQVMANKLYEKDPEKFGEWQTDVPPNILINRVRTISNSSTNSDEYPLQDEQDDTLPWSRNADENSGKYYNSFD